MSLSSTAIKNIFSEGTAFIRQIVYRRQILMYKDGPRVERATGGLHMTKQ